LEPKNNDYSHFKVMQSCVGVDAPDHPATASTVFSSRWCFAFSVFDAKA
jgi:hypothetical protein